MTPKELADRIPQLDVASQVFPAGKDIDDVYDELTPIARKWQAENPNSWGFRFFSKLFFEGGKAPAGNEIDGITNEDTARIYAWVRAAMGSWYPKHENKEAVCGMLWATFFEEPE